MADGQVTIKTVMDTSNAVKQSAKLNNSLNTVSGTLSRIGGLMASAFSIYYIVNFAKEAMSLASDLEEVQNVVNVSFGDMSYKMKDFADIAIESFGMSELTAKQMASTFLAIGNGMGQGLEIGSDKAIELTGRLADVASFYNKTMGEVNTIGRAVYSGETEPLKAIGVIMSQDALNTYALANGYKELYTEMDQANKLLLRQEYFLQATSQAAGDFVRTQDSWANQTRVLSERWKEMQSVWGEAFINIGTLVLPVLNKIISAMVTMGEVAIAVSQAIYKLFTGQDLTAELTQTEGFAETTEEIEGAVGATEDLTDATEGTAKAAKTVDGAISGFEELNTINNAGSSGGSTESLSPDSTGSGGGTGGAGGTGDAGGLTANVEDSLAGIDITFPDIDFTNLITSFEALKTSLAGFGSTLWEGLQYLYENILVPMATWVIEDFLPVFLEVLAAAIDVLNAAIEALAPYADWLLQNFLAPLAEWTGGVIVATLEALRDALEGISDWISENQEPFTIMVGTVSAFAAAWGLVQLGALIVNLGGITGLLAGLAAALWAATGAKILDNIQTAILVGLYAAEAVQTAALVVWQGLLTAAHWLGAAAATAFGVAMAILTSPITLVIAAIAAIIVIIVLLVKNWDTVKEVAARIWDSIVDLWGDFASWFSETIFDPISDAFTGFIDFIKSCVNSIIGFINGMLSSVTSGINTVIEALNSLSFTIPNWVPGFGGLEFGFNLNTLTAPAIPMLATGSVIPPNSPFLAMLGDNTSEHEIVSPLSTMKQAMQEVLNADGRGGGEEIILPISVLLDGEVIYKNQEKVKRNRGKSNGMGAHAR